MSIFENVAAGLKLNGVRDRKVIAERVEKALGMAALWGEVKDQLDRSGNEPLRRTAAALVYRSGFGR